MASHYASPRWSAEVTDCSVPMTFDQHSRCSYGCLYCFSQYQKGVGAGKQGYFAGQVNPVDVDGVLELFNGNPKREDLKSFSAYVAERKVFQWGGLADPFDEYERLFGTALKILPTLREMEYPITFSTKGAWWTSDERYTALFKGASFWNVKVSIITLDKEKARRVERGVATPEERLAAIRRLTDLGVPVTLRLRPFIIGVSTPTYIELIHKAADAGATAVTTEFFCYELRSPALKRSLPELNSVCGFDITKFYKTASQGSGYLRLNREIKRKYVDEMDKACKERGLRFYVSDAHFKERSCTGSCCGLPDTWNYSRGQYTEALLIAKAKGEVRWSDISDKMSHLDNRMIGSHKPPGFNTCTSEWKAKHYYRTMTGLLRYFWNDTKSAKSPQVYFGGILVADRLDENGDVIYRYVKEAE